MRLMTFEAPSSFNLFFAGDTHEGNKAFSRHAFDRFSKIFFSDFEGIPQKFNRWIHMGDPADFISLSDKRHDPNIHDKSIVQQFDTITKRYKPFAPQMVGMLNSNHAMSLKDLGTVTEWLCAKERLDIPYLTSSARLTFQDKNGELMFKVYVAHGRKTISSTADDEVRRYSNMQLILKRHMKRMASDCAVMVKGHAHKLIVLPPTPRLSMIDDGKKLKKIYPDPYEYQKMQVIPWEMRWYGCSGSFLRTFLEEHDTYSEQAEYDPVDMGFLVLIIRNGRIKELRAIAL